VARQLPGEQSDVAQVQSTAVAQPAGRAAHANCASGQPPKQPAGPPSGQLGVALLPAGQVPPSGSGVQVGGPQFCLPTHSSAGVQVASPHVVGPASFALLSDDDLQLAKVSTTSSARSAYRADRLPRVTEKC
jgi:hypothetical protein